MKNDKFNLSQFGYSVSLDKTKPNSEKESSANLKLVSYIRNPPFSYNLPRRNTVRPNDDYLLGDIFAKTTRIYKQSEGVTHSKPGVKRKGEAIRKI